MPWKKQPAPAASELPEDKLRAKADALPAAETALKAARAALAKFDAETTRLIERRRSERAPLAAAESKASGTREAAFLAVCELDSRQAAALEDLHDYRLASALGYGDVHMPHDPAAPVLHVPRERLPVECARRVEIMRAAEKRREIEHARGKQPAFVKPTWSEALAAFRAGELEEPGR